MIVDLARLAQQDSGGGVIWIALSIVSAAVLLTLRAVAYRVYESDLRREVRLQRIADLERELGIGDEGGA